MSNVNWQFCKYCGFQHETHVYCYHHRDMWTPINLFLRQIGCWGSTSQSNGGSEQCSRAGLQIIFPSWGFFLMVRSIDFDHFLYVAFKEIASLENTNDSIDSDCFLFLILSLKRAEWNSWQTAVLKKGKTARYLVCQGKCMRRPYHFWKK